MENSPAPALPGQKKEQPSKVAVTTEDIFKKLLELEIRLKKIEEKLTRPLIG
jgi:hypothetical protein